MIEKNFYKHKQKESNDDGGRKTGIDFSGSKKVSYTEMASTRLMEKIFDRFNVEPIENEKKLTYDKNCILAHEFLVGMICICHMRNALKIEMLFKLYDDHNRNFLESKELYNLLQTIEKLFAKEKATININNDFLF
tara:strand:+ start:322 stop:729 length:408 start_codon:yes stop_codon:yes gene_type:complete